MDRYYLAQDIPFFFTLAFQESKVLFKFVWRNRNWIKIDETLNFCWQLLLWYQNISCYSFPAPVTRVSIVSCLSFPGIFYHIGSYWWEGWYLMLVYIVKHVQNNAFLAQKPSLVVGFVLTEIFQVHVMPLHIWNQELQKSHLLFYPLPLLRFKGTGSWFSACSLIKSPFQFIINSIG